jgi:hypothetical protein
MVPGVPREAQQLVCVCANEFGGAADRGEYRQAAGAVARNAGQILMSAIGGKADIGLTPRNVPF